MEDVFMSSISEAYSVGLKLDFIACPDIVAGGVESLEFSMEWAEGRLRTARNLALVVQDGMTTRDVSRFLPLPQFSHIFIGGTKEWKWPVAGEWCDFAHKNRKKAHIGQCGRLEYLRAAKRVGADSVDSTSFVRNQSWEIIDEFRSGSQMEIGGLRDSV